MKKKLILFLICIIAAVGGFYGFQSFNSKPMNITQKESDAIPTGNSTGNLANSGYVARFNDNIYGDINPTGQGLFKSNLKLKKLVKLTDDQALYVNVEGQWVYYVNYSDNRRLYKVGIDGKNRTQLTTNMVDCLNVEDGWIYYVDTTANGIIKKLSVDGKVDNTLLKDKGNLNLLVKNGKIYYRNKSTIYKMDEDGTGIIKIAVMRTTKYEGSTDWKGNFDVNGGFLYYPGGDGSLYCISVDGMNNTKLTGGNVESINIYNGYVYYYSFTKKTISRIKLEGQVKEEYVLGGGEYYYINIVTDEGVMFKDKYNLNKSVNMVLMNLAKS
jgi:phage pi2 protein 07